MKWESCRLILDMNVGCILSKTRIESRYYGGGTYYCKLQTAWRRDGVRLSLQNPKDSLCRPSEGIIFLVFVMILEIGIPGSQDANDQILTL